MTRNRGLLLVVVLSASLLAGCGLSASDLPLPGGAGVEGPTYELTAVFRDVLNLPDGAYVKLDGVDVGRVTRIEAENYTARVGFELPVAVPLPRGTSVELRQTTPLGEVFVALRPPAGGGPGPVLRDGDTIGLESTDAAATVEDLLSALSALVNGGGLARIQTIVREANAAFDGVPGRPEQVVALLTELRTTVATLNARTAEIDRVLAATDRLAITLRARSGTVDAAFDQLTPAISVLADQSSRFTRALTSTAALSGTGDDLLRRSGGDLRAILRDAGPVLDGLAALDRTLAPSLRNLVALGRALEGATRGEAVAGTALTDLSVGNVPGVDGPFPGPEDLVDGGRSFEQSFGELLGRLNPMGGPGVGR